MQLICCKPELNSRQMLWGLVSEIDDLKRTLTEVCVVDTNLFNKSDYYVARTKLDEALHAINQLRRYSTLVNLGELSKKITDVNSLIEIL